MQTIGQRRMTKGKTVKAVWKLQVLAETDNPVIVDGNYYYPPDSIKKELFLINSKTTVCGWKGTAEYYDVRLSSGETLSAGAWHYDHPKPEAAAIKGHVAFYPQVEHVLSVLG